MGAGSLKLDHHSVLTQDCIGKNRLGYLKIEWCFLVGQRIDMDQYQESYTGGCRQLADRRQAAVTGQFGVIGPVIAEMASAG